MHRQRESCRVCTPPPTVRAPARQRAAGGRRQRRMRAVGVLALRRGGAGARCQQRGGAKVNAKYTQNWRFHFARGSSGRDPDDARRPPHQPSPVGGGVTVKVAFVARRGRRTVDGTPISPRRRCVLAPKLSRAPLAPKLSRALLARKLARYPHHTSSDQPCLPAPH